MVEKLQSMEAVIGVGVLDDYLVLSIGETSEHLVHFGQAELLVDRDEFKPLQRNADCRLVAISFANPEVVAAGSFTKNDVHGLMAAATSLLPEDLDGNAENRMRADLAGLSRDWERRLGEPGATLEYAYITDAGIEGYCYNWAKRVRLDGRRPLTLLGHVGGAPILFAVARVPCSVPEYDALVKWLGKLHEYFELIVVEKLAPDRRAEFGRTKQRIDRALARLDSANRKVLLSLRDGQVGFVVDAKTFSKRWCACMQESEDPLPMLECAVVAGVSDADLLEKGIDEFLEVVDQLLEMIHEWDPDGFPVSELPRLQAGHANGGTTRFFPLPETWQIDASLIPNVGASDKIVVASMTRNHTRRLLAQTPRSFAGTPLADPHRPLAAAGSFDFSAFVDAVEPWVDYMFDQKKRDWDPQTDSFPLLRVRDEVKTMMQILRCFRGVSWAAHFEKKALVTHFEWRFADLD